MDTAAIGLVAPALLSGEPAVYPQGETRDAVVGVELTLTADGTIERIDVTRSAGPAFDDAARVAAAKLRFAPATKDGVGIPAVIPFEFSFVAPVGAAPVAGAATTTNTTTIRTTTTQATQAQAQIANVELEVQGPPPLQEPTRHSLAREEIRNVPGTGGDVLRSVETLPGVGRPPPFDGDLIVRGAAPQDSQVFIDGTAVPFVYHFGGFTSVVPGDMLDRLDFYPGNFGPEYGRGIGGIVDVSLRSPRRDGFHGLLQVDLIDGRAMLETPIGERTAVLVGARRSWVDAWIGSALQDEGTTVHTAPVYWDGQLVLEHDFSSSTRGRLSVFGVDDRFELALNAPDPGDPASGGVVGGGARYVRVQAQLQSDLSERVRFTNTLSWGLTDSDNRFGGGHFDFTFHDLSLRSDLRVELSEAVALRTGIDVLASNYDVALAFRLYNATNAVPSPAFARPLRNVAAEVSRVQPAAYAGLELRPIPTLKLLPGVRADFADDTDEVTVGPRFTARWDAIELPQRTTLKLGVGLYHQVPQPEQSLDPVGTPGIESNRALHTSLGVEQELPAGFEVQAEGFYKRLSHLVVAVPDEERLIGVRFDNSGDGHVFGGELLLRYKPALGRLSGWLAYTLSRSERRDRQQDGYFVYEWDQTHVLSAVLNLDLGRRWTLGARFRYVTGRPYTPYSGGVVDLDAGAYAPIADGAPGSARLAPFHQLDLRIEKLWQFEAWALSAYLELRNAYARDNPEDVIYRYDYEERAPVTGLPILPVLGVKGEL